MQARITKRTVDQAVLDESQRELLIWDTDLKGFGLRVTRGSKSYLVQHRVKGRTVRTVLGRHDPLTPDIARQRARVALGKMADGVNTSDERRGEIAERVTLREVLERYLMKRKTLSPRTAYDYRRMVGVLPPRVDGKKDPREPPVLLRDWKDKPIALITRDMVERRHALIGKRSHAQANQAMRILRALFNFAESEFETAAGLPLVPVNPVKRLSQQRAWYQEKVRRTYIKPTEMADWWDAVSTVESDSRDYLRLLILTGLRRTEAAQLVRGDVDMKAQSFTVRDTKNGDDHTLPMSDYLVELFTRRLEASKSKYLFPGTGTDHHLIEPKKAVAKVREACGVDFTLHDLRRTFGTIAESLDIPAYALKRLLNHKMKNDVTFNNYLQIDVDRLRGPMQKITTHVLAIAGAIPAPKNVVPIGRSAS